MSISGNSADIKVRWGISAAPRKQLAALADAVVAPVPAALHISLLQNNGSTSTPVVQTGDAVLKGQHIAGLKVEVKDELADEIPVHASSSGTVTAIDEQDTAAGRTLCITIATDGLDRLHPGCVPMPEAGTLSAEQIRSKIAAAGIVGLGGALFPTATKLHAGAVQTLLINGAECEPYINCDNQLMQQHATEIVNGAEILQRACGAEAVIFACKAEMKDAHAALFSAISDADNPSLSVRRAPDVYPAGGERQLIEHITGQEVPSGGLPADVGIICQNVGTAYAVHQLFHEGLPLISRIVTVSGGGLRESLNFEVRIGTPVTELIALCGGYLDDRGGHAPDRLLMGGPMMGVPLPHDQVPVTPAMNCVIAGHATELHHATEELPCIRCGDCLPVCPARLNPMQLLDLKRRSDLPGLEQTGVSDCIECGCCDYVCPSSIALTANFIQAKQIVREQQLLSMRAGRSEQRYAAHAARVAEREREQQEQLQSQTSDLDASGSKQALDDLLRRIGKNAKDDGV